MLPCTLSFTTFNMFVLQGVFIRLSLKGFLEDLYLKRKIGINSFRHLTIFNLSISIFIIIVYTTIIYYFNIPYPLITALTELSIVSVILNLFDELPEFKNEFKPSNIRQVFRFWLYCLDNKKEMYTSSIYDGKPTQNVNAMKVVASEYKASTNIPGKASGAETSTNASASGSASGSGNVPDNPSGNTPKSALWDAIDRDTDYVYDDNNPLGNQEEANRIGLKARALADRRKRSLAASNWTWSEKAFMQRWLLKQSISQPGPKDALTIYNRIYGE